MFTVGEFSRIAQVSKRLLRYYDEFSLLKPVRTDDFTGYRYYSAEQLPELNRILALKELGFSLDQIQRMLRDKVSTEELQGMLQLKKAEIEQHVLDEYQRLHNTVLGSLYGDASRFRHLYDSNSLGPDTMDPGGFGDTAAAVDTAFKIYRKQHGSSSTSSDR